MARTARLQEQTYGVKPAELEGDDRADYFRTMVAALVFELGEMSNEIGWKTWASDRSIAHERYIKELVDVLHFAANLAVLSGVTDEELNAVYLAKMRVNEERQRRADYNGRTDGKCTLCKRSFDDVGECVEMPGVCAVCSSPSEGPNPDLILKD